MLFPDVVTLPDLAAHEAQALRSLHVSHVELQHTYESAQAASGRASRTHEIAEVYTDGDLFTHHPEALLELSHLATDYEREVGMLAWRYAGAAIVLGVTVLDRLIQCRPPLAEDTVTRLCEEPTLGELRSALSIPHTTLFLARGQKVRQDSEDRRQMAMKGMENIFSNAAAVSDRSAHDPEIETALLAEVSPPNRDPLYDGILEYLFALAEQLPYEISWYLKRSGTQTSARGRSLTSLRQVLNCDASATATRQGPDTGAGPAWKVYLCPAHSEALPAWPGPLAPGAVPEHPCGIVHDHRGPVELLRSHADLWLTELSGLPREVFDGDWTDALRRACEVLDARLEEESQADTDAPGVLSDVALMTSMAHDAAADGSLLQATTCLSHAETLALRL
ncbi:hypothetical protein ACIOJD_33665 [Streptomyces sp. NPDC088116]|uniref:hypothetical protein n=1 Tax=Streptomyces sp. NPDC088116 TaxID=3365825 RepID=UPI0037F3FCB0